MEELLEIDYVFYRNIIKELNTMFNYNAVCNLLGNSFAGEVSHEIVTEANPLMKTSNNNTGGMKKLDRETLSKLSGKK